MKLFLLVSSLTIIGAYNVHDDAIVNGVRHQREILYDNLSSPSKLVVDYTTNCLFYYNGDSRLLKFNINTRELKYFKQRSTQCISIDQDTHDIFIGTASGIYKYGQGNDEAELFGAQGVDVWRMYFKRVLYYNKYSTGNIYMFVNGYMNMFVAVDNMVDMLLVDNEDNIYYSSDKLKVYSQKSGKKHVLYDGTAYVTAMAMDKNGTVYFCADDGIYEVIRHNATVNKIVSTVCYYGIAFDSENNIIYSDHYRIMRLKPIHEREKSIIENITKNDPITYNDTDNNDQLKSLNQKIDKLIQKIDKLQAENADEHLHIVNSTHTIHLGNIKNLNITLSLTGEAGADGDVGQMSQTP